MKRYIKSASSLDQLSKVIQDRLMVSGVDLVKIQSINSKYAQVKLIYSDGSESDTFTVRFKNNPNRQDASTSWNPDWKVQDDGSVVDSNNDVIGYFKLLKRKPQVTSANYQENSLVVDFGTKSIDLTENSGPQVAKAVKR